MFRKFFSAPALGLALLLAGPAGIGAVPAAADQCLSATETRAAVANGQAVPLSSVLRQLRATLRGDIVGQQLCDMGGRLVYLIDVYSSADAKTTHVQIDAASGAINY